MIEEGRTRPPDEAPHLLVVDDDERLRSLLSRYLSANGFRVTTSASAEEARRRVDQIAFDMLVLDVMMPGESGVDLARSLRQRSDVPIVFLTARSEFEGRIAGLEAGADDYVAKPFEPRELVLRINAILKRGGRLPTRSETVRFGPYTFDMRRGELTDGSGVIRITEREREMLRALAAEAGQTVPRHVLLSASDASERAVDVQINRLRRKIEADPANPVHVQSVRGVGYRLVSDP